jgi:hypothetical protein
LPERPFLTLDEQQRVARDDEEVLLVRFPVIHPDRLARAEDVEADAELREGRVTFEKQALAASFAMRQRASIALSTNQPSPAETMPWSVCSSGASGTLTAGGSP